MDEMLPNLHGYHWERTKSLLCLIMVDDMHIFKVISDMSWLKLPPYNGLGGGGHLFSLQTLLYFYALCLLIPRNVIH